MSIKLIILGPPGVGKGTQANIIKDTYNIPLLSTGEILRNEIEIKSDIGMIAKNYIDDGLLVPDNILLKINEELSIRSGKYGDYIFYMRENMKKPRFLNLKKKNYEIKK